MPQVEGADYVVTDGDLVFPRRLERESVGKGKWTSMFLGISGSYGKDDSVDVVYTVGAERRIAREASVRRLERRLAGARP